MYLGCPGKIRLFKKDSRHTPSTIGASGLGSHTYPAPNHHHYTLLHSDEPVESDPGKTPEPVAATISGPLHKVTHTITQVYARFKSDHAHSSMTCSPETFKEHMARKGVTWAPFSYDPSRDEEFAREAPLTFWATFGPDNPLAQNPSATSSSTAQGR